MMNQWTWSDPNSQQVVFVDEDCVAVRWKLEPIEAISLNLWSEDGIVNRQLQKQSQELLQLKHTIIILSGAYITWDLRRVACKRSIRDTPEV